MHRPLLFFVLPWLLLSSRDTDMSDALPSPCRPVRLLARSHLLRVALSVSSPALTFSVSPCPSPRPLSPSPCRPVRLLARSQLCTFHVVGARLSVLFSVVLSSVSVVPGMSLFSWHLCFSFVMMLFAYLYYDAFCILCQLLYQLICCGLGINKHFLIPDYLSRNRNEHVTNNIPKLLWLWPTVECFLWLMDSHYDNNFAYSKIANNK